MDDLFYLNKENVFIKDVTPTMMVNSKLNRTLPISEILYTHIQTMIKYRSNQNKAWESNFPNFKRYLYQRSN
ncbi:hypothetical protein PB01_09395 [Psychrobacillus glaciei]|uniref:Uncharacterized protein n=1 Tax=Psychrobacillus glaciei TaxID=2283160 RepID=A0A5J6SQF3_9BACI|nr:hypothetical protein [Psychrobacillus glaciei]QFF99024.1 hypothetical protein PB01_09395 [Psychrobacillus glaciei]